jgi:carnitine O-acetyltransferase
MYVFQTLRSVTRESAAFTRAFATPGATPKEKEQALRLAVQAHGNRAKEAKEGFGVDRHLFGLKNLAYHKQQRLPGYTIPAIFKDKAYGVLSSSVLSTSNCGSDALTMFGFGPGARPLPPSLLSDPVITCEGDVADIERLRTRTRTQLWAMAWAWAT